MEKTHKRIAITFMALLFTGMYLWVSSCFNADKTKPITIADKKNTAMAYAQLAVKEKLVSPGSAQFAFVPLESIEQANDSTFIILSYVDSQNKLGVLLRTHYKCTVVVTGDKGTCIDIKLEENAI